MSDSLKRVTFTEFLVNWETLPKAPSGLNKKSDLTGLIFDKLWPVERLQENYFGVKWRCRCLCGGTRDVESKNLLRGVVGDCGCRALWRIKKQRKVRKVAKKKRQAARLMEQQEQRERNAVAKKKRKALLKQTKAAARKRWADYRGNKTTPENEPKKCEQKAA